MGQLQQLSDSLERARSQYDAANAQLAQIQRDLRENRHELRIAKSNLHESQRTIAKRLVTLYTTDQASTLEVILGAKNLDDMINRMDSAKSVTALDTRILSQVKTFRTAVKRHGTLLANARASQARVVAERAAAKQSIESKINEQNNLLSSLKGQIAQLVAADAARQLQMAREAQARLAAQQQRLPAAAVDHGRRRLGDRAGGGHGRCAAARRTATSPTSRCRSSARRTCGPARRRADSTARASSCGRTRRSASRSRTPRTRSTATASRSRATSSQPGDLVFFDGLGHVGIYIGGGQFVHAPHTGDVVKISSLDESWYSATFVGARRIL